VERAWTGTSDACPMFAHRTATGLTVALLALPATAIADSAPSPTDAGGGSAALSDHYGWGQPRHDRADAPTSSLAGTTSQQDLSGPDAADAARAGDIAKAMEHYQRSQPAPAAADATPVWPEVAFAGVVLLVTTGGVVRARIRRSRRVVA
jgi:hypothetical protein